MLKMKKIVAIGISVFTLLSYGSLLASAASVSRTIDNDPKADSGNTHGYYGFSYLSSGSCYNSDARIASSVSGNYYAWVHPQTSLGSPTSVTVKLQVYLNHSRFNDPAAQYLVMKDGSLATVATINQNTAPGGWGYTYTKTISSCTILNQVRVRASNAPGKETGADGVNVVYSY